MNIGEQQFDAIVIGSGFAGAVTACRLSEAGLKVCILERGRRYSGVDLPVLPAETFWPRSDGDQSERKLPDFARAFWQLGQGLWELRDLGDLMVAQAAGFGGGSLIYANVHLRAPVEVFATWPEEYRDEKLQGYYDLAAYMLDVQQVPEELPKTVGFQKAAEKLAGPAGRAGQTRVFRPPLAVNFRQEGKNRFGAEQGSCDMRGECIFGCAKQAKNTLDLNYLHVAEDRGAEVRTLAEVIGIKLTRDATPRYEVEYRNHLKRGRSESVRAHFVFLCAGAVNTTELLLRWRDEQGLSVEGNGLGTRFHPNADELAVVFDCKEEQETDRGPTITTAWLYDDEKKDGTWLMLQDGGLPAHLEPMLGIFRSPLWLQRNAFLKAGEGGDEGPPPPKLQHAALPQRVGYAALPVDSIVDLLTGLTGGALAGTLPLSHEVSRSLLNLARGGRDLQRLPAEQRWTLCPQQLHSALDRIRENTLADLAILAEPIVENFINGTAEKMPDGLVAKIREMALGNFDIGNRREADLRKWALQAGIQGIWGSQAGLLGAVASVLSPLFAPAPKEVLQRVASLVRWALDYRGGDGHTTVLLAMGRDSKSARLELERDEVVIGSRINTQDGRSASGVLVHRSNDTLVLSHLEGTFREGEPVFADTRPLGICTKVQREELEIGVRETADLKIASAQRGTSHDKGDRVSLCVLSLTPMTFEEEPRRFRTDSYREGVREIDRKPCKPEAWLRARLPPPHETPERSTQELLLRDVAQALGGELRTNPLHPFLGRRITVHAQGGCPMAEREEDGVTKPSGEVFGCEGLYVMDAAAFPTPVGVNPSATITAVAERKVGEFIGAWAKHSSRKPDESAFATKWVERDRPALMREASRWAETNAAWLDPVAAIKAKSVPPSPPPVKKPIGIEFDEEMIGTHRQWGSNPGPECSIKTDLTASIDDLADFLATDRQGAGRELGIVHGTAWEPEGSSVVIDLGDGAGPRTCPVDYEASRIWLRSATDDCGKQTRSIEYLLEFKVEDQRYQLDGIKTIRDDARFDVWEDTTTLCFVLRKRAEGYHRRPGEAARVPWSDDDPVRWGVLRLPASAFFGLQVPSLKATNITDDPARQVWAVSSFAAFFFGNLVDVYVPALERVVDIGRGALERGHV